MAGPAHWRKVWAEMLAKDRIDADAEVTLTPANARAGREDDGLATAYSIYHGMDAMDQKKPAGVAVFNDDGVLERLDGEGCHEMFGEVFWPRAPPPEQFVSRYKNWVLVRQEGV